MSTQKSFVERVLEIEKEAEKWLQDNLKEKFVFCEEDSEELTEMPDFETFNNHGSDGYSNVISIEPDPENKGHIKLIGINKETGVKVEAYIYEVDSFATCSIADYVKGRELNK